jgi:hypothetical protein
MPYLFLVSVRILTKFIIIIIIIIVFYCAQIREHDFSCTDMCMHYIYIITYIHAYVRNMYINTYIRTYTYNCCIAQHILTEAMYILHNLSCVYSTSLFLLRVY